jgi:uncharacterized membrane-anchored protein YhcB (DUF1043 family)
MSLSDRIIDWLVENVLGWVFIILLVGLIIGGIIFAVSAYKQSQSPTFSLYKNEWTCTNKKTETVTTYVKSGDVLIPVVSHVDSCLQYTKIEK